MNGIMTYTRRVLLATASAALVLAACADTAPLGVEQTDNPAQFAAAGDAQANRIFATLRRVTARYHDLDVAIADGFFLLHPCEERGDEEPVGAVYVHWDRLIDGVADPQTPDALIYETSRNGKPKLVGVEFAIPYTMSAEAPTFLGQTFQREDEFGVWALHLWVWRANPEGMFAEANPRVTCDAE